MTLKVLIAGAAGWTGAPLVEAVVAGTLLAIRRVPEITGVPRGVGRLLFG